MLFRSIRQITANRLPMRIAGFAAMSLCLIPGLPKIPFLLAGGTLLLLSTRVEEQAADDELAAEAAALAPAVERPDQLAEEIQVDPLGLELSADIIDLVDSQHGGDLLERVKALRRKVATELGVVLPLVRTRDNLDLPSRTYARSEEHTSELQSH